MKAWIAGRCKSTPNSIRNTALATAVAVPVLVLSAIVAAAQDKQSPQGDVAAGKALAEKSCATCHGLKGVSSLEGTPYLAGQFAGYMRSAIAAYKEGRRQDQTMSHVFGPLSDADIANVTAYFASLKPFNKTLPAPEGGADATDEDPFAAVRKATASCAGCHGEDGNSQIAGIPSLAGQHAPYFIAAMHLYKDGTRTDETMKSLAAGLSDAMIEDMAYFYAAMEPKMTKNVGKGDPLAGIGVTASCVGCHGLDGNNADPKIPRLAGIDADFLAKTASEYKSGKRAQPVMQEATANLRQADIANMASYYASREPRALPVSKPLTTQEWVERCDRCHGKGGNSDNPSFPILAGQKETYLVKAMKHYHMGERKSQFMFAMSFSMTESDIQKLAHYYSRQRSGK